MSISTSCRRQSWSDASAVISVKDLGAARALREPMLRKLLNLFWRGRSDPLPAVDGAARTTGLVFGGRIVPELPRGLRVYRGNEEEERRESDGVDEISRGSTKSDNDEQEADERDGWLAEPQHGRIMRLVRDEIQLVAVVDNKRCLREDGCR